MRKWVTGVTAVLALGGVGGAVASGTGVLGLSAPSRVRLVVVTGSGGAGPRRLACGDELDAELRVRTGMSRAVTSIKKRQNRKRKKKGEKRVYPSTAGTAQQRPRVKEYKASMCACIFGQRMHSLGH